MTTDQDPGAPGRPRRRWLWNCAMGCGLVALLTLGSCFMGFLWLKDTFRGVSVADDSYDRIEGAHGSIEDYVPPADGIVEAERLKAFLAVREAVRGRAERVVEVHENLRHRIEARDSVPGKIAAGLGAMRDLISELGDYVAARNQALLEQEMGLGEYAYLYSLTYYSWLGHRPGEGHALSLGSEEARERTESVEAESPFDPRTVRRRYRRYVVQLMRNQLEAAREGSSEDAEWSAILERELERFENHPARVPWQDGLPAAVEAPLQPYRQRLELTYYPATNRFELPLAEHEQRW